MTTLEDRPLCQPAVLPEWMTTTGPIDWRAQPRDEHGLWVKAEPRARRAQAIAALDAGEHITIHDLPPDPDVTRHSQHSGAVITYTRGTTRVTVPAPPKCPHGSYRACPRRCHR